MAPGIERRRSGAPATVTWPASSGRAPAMARVGAAGGLGLRIDGHMYDPERGFAYEMTSDSSALTRRFTELQTRMLTVKSRCAVSGAVYTQLSDVENELNGFYTYDRRVLKMDAAAVRKANRKLITSTNGDTPPLPPGSPNAIGVYPFNEGTGSTAEDTAGDHDATLVDNPTWTTGRSGSALQFNGSNQYADTNAAILDTTGNYTVSAWVKLDRLGGFATAVSQDGATNSAFFLQYSGADNRFAFSFAGLRALAPTAPETDRWYHLTGVRDAADGSLTLYVDGQKTATAAACLGDASTGHTVIGRAQYGGNQVDYWPGALDEIRLYDRALSPTEVETLYKSTK
ncbi:LamG domain-containing protein [Spirillospora sp. NPDC048911]|uniref:LamG domain-containing protein n=1 Tax=Spirillospora sp. NPDC048911 TaxID=3364527 RepID=UPI00371692E0